MSNKNPTPEEKEGLAHEEIFEEFVSPLIKDSEEVINTKRNHNAWIIIGRDRPSDEASGYGSFPKNDKGNKCTTIDIVVGRYSAKSGKTIDNISYDKNKVVGNNFQEDASRIYISQKTDIDKNFLIDKGTTLSSPLSKAAIGIKSDNVRIIGRESVKIIAKTGENNSLGTMDQGKIYGVEILTGISSEEDIQPLVKADNLKNFLEHIQTEISKLSGALRDYISFQLTFNEEVAQHTHDGHFRSDLAGAVKVLESFDLPQALQKFTSSLTKTNKSLDIIRKSIETSQVKYLNKNNPKDYIGSMYNRTN